MKRPDLLRHREVFIHSMEVLIGRYEMAKARGITKQQLEHEMGEKCLLCNPIGIEESRDFCAGPIPDLKAIGCVKLGCPWVVMEDLPCFPRVRGWENVVYDSTDPKVQQARIDQLREWIEAYKNFEEA